MSPGPFPADLPDDVYAALGGDPEKRSQERERSAQRLSEAFGEVKEADSVAIRAELQQLKAELAVGGKAGGELLPVRQETTPTPTADLLSACEEAEGLLPSLGGAKHGFPLVESEIDAIREARAVLRTAIAKARGQ